MTLRLGLSLLKQCYHLFNSCVFKHGCSKNWTAFQKYTNTSLQSLSDTFLMSFDQQIYLFIMQSCTTQVSIGNTVLVSIIIWWWPRCRPKLLTYKVVDCVVHDYIINKYIYSTVYSCGETKQWLMCCHRSQKEPTANS